MVGQQRARAGAQRHWAAARHGLTQAGLALVLVACGAANPLGARPAAPSITSPAQQADRERICKMYELRKAKVKAAAEAADPEAMESQLCSLPTRQNDLNGFMLCPDGQWDLQQEGIGLQGAYDRLAAAEEAAGRPGNAAMLRKKQLRCPVGLGPDQQKDLRAEEARLRGQRLAAAKARAAALCKDGHSEAAAWLDKQYALHKMPGVAPADCAAAGQKSREFSFALAGPPEVQAALTKAATDTLKRTADPAAAQVRVEASVSDWKLERGSGPGQRSVEVMVGRTQVPNPAIANAQQRLERAEDALKRALSAQAASVNSSDHNKQVRAQEVAARQADVSSARKHLSSLPATVQQEVKEAKNYAVTEHWAELRGKLTLKLVPRTGDAQTQQLDLLARWADHAHPAVPALGLGARSAGSPNEALLKQQALASAAAALQTELVKLASQRNAQLDKIVFAHPRGHMARVAALATIAFGKGNLKGEFLQELQWFMDASLMSW